MLMKILNCASTVLLTTAFLKLMCRFFGMKKLRRRAVTCLQLCNIIADSPPFSSRRDPWMNPLYSAMCRNGIGYRYTLVWTHCTLLRAESRYLRQRLYFCLPFRLLKAPRQRLSMTACLLCQELIHAAGISQTVERWLWLAMSRESYRSVEGACDLIIG